MRRLRLVLGLLAAFLAGWWAREARAAYQDARELVDAFAGAAAAWGDASEAATARPPRADGRLRADERCPTCDHLGSVHDPDLGCTGLVLWRDALAGSRRDAPCPCLRRRCPCPPGSPR